MSFRLDDTICTLLIIVRVRVTLRVRFSAHTVARKMREMTVAKQ